MNAIEKPEFVYVTYIKTTPEKLWYALIDPAVIKTYWSDYQVTIGQKAGDAFAIHTPEGELGDEGVMLEVDPPHKLSYTWHHVKYAEFAAEPASRVTFTLEPQGGVVKLTLVHDQFIPDSKMYQAIRNGWPGIVSGLKSLLESGKPMPRYEAKGPDTSTQSTSNRDTVYVTYIATTAEKVWHALTDGETSKKYFFGRRVQSDWKIGSKFEMYDDEGHGLDVNGVVLECNPPHRLKVTWRVDWIEEFRHLPDAYVTYQIDELGDVVRLTMIEEHDEALDPKYLEGGRKGWPMILSSLKSLLEGGEGLKIDSGIGNPRGAGAPPALTK
jgi:uncharacterized protein YndB with AHSA1/START domain